MKNFILISKSFDAGEFITAIKIPKDDISINDVEVSALYVNTEYVQRKIDTYKIEREIENIETIGNYSYINLKYQPSPNFKNYRFFSEAIKNYSLKIKGEEYSCVGIENKDIDAFCDMHSTNIHYRLFKPNTQKPAPLVVWLHGIGEFGIDNRLQISNSLVTAWAKEENQKCFGETGAYIAAAQATEQCHTPSFVKEMIDEIIANNNIDEKRIYIGGCSMGGHGTNQVIEQYPDLFAAAFPTCPASAISEETAKSLVNSKMALYYIHCIGDPACTVTNSMLSVKRLKELGGNANIALFDKIEVNNEPTGAHSVWIYVNDNFSGDDNRTSGVNFHHGSYETSYNYNYYDGHQVNFFDLYHKEHKFDHKDVSTWTKFRGETMDLSLLTEEEMTIDCVSVSPKELGYKNLFSWIAAQKKD